MGSFTFKLQKDISWDLLPSSYRKIFRGIVYLQVTERYFVGSFTFKLQKDISWDRLPSSYRNSPCFNLDAEIISTLQVQENELQIANDGLEPEVLTEGAEKQILFEIPKKVYPKKSTASACREILNKIKSLTFVVYDGKALEKLEEQLLDIVECFDKKRSH